MWIRRGRDARSITTTLTYDAENRMTGKSYSNSDPSVSYSYDQTSCNSLTITNGAGRRTCMSDGSEPSEAIGAARFSISRRG